MFRRRFTVNNLSLSTVQASFAVLLRVVERRIKVQSQPVPLVAEGFKFALWRFLTFQTEHARLGM
jgi:hypothetical protein